MARSSVSKVQAGPGVRRDATPPARPVHGARLQAKLTVSQPGDRLEQEADRVADQVMRMPAPALADADVHRPPIRSPVLQRLCPDCDAPDDSSRRLLAHELTHVLQRQVDADRPGPCDQTHIDNLIEPAFLEARRWRRLAAAWLEAHLDHIRARAALGRDGFVRIGQRVYDELMLLERHFRISTVLRVSLPYAPDDLVSVEDLQRFGNASYWVRRRFGDVELTLSYLCQANCPRGRVGSETLGSAVAGSRELTLYTHCFDPQSAPTQAGVALHEAFHASFSEFDHDTYSFESSYPGSNALTNADSFATFAAIVATGRDYRIIVLPEMTIHGGEE